MWGLFITDAYIQHVHALRTTSAQRIADLLLAVRWEYDTLVQGLVPGFYEGMSDRGQWAEVFADFKDDVTFRTTMTVSELRALDCLVVLTGPRQLLTIERNWFSTLSQARRLGTVIIVTQTSYCCWSGEFVTPDNTIYAPGLPVCRFHDPGDVRCQFYSQLVDVIVQPLMERVRVP